MARLSSINSTCVRACVRVRKMCRRARPRARERVRACERSRASGAGDSIERWQCALGVVEELESRGLPPTPARLLGELLICAASSQAPWTMPRARGDPSVNYARRQQYRRSLTPGKRLWEASWRGYRSMRRNWYPRLVPTDPRHGAPVATKQRKSRKSGTSQSAPEGIRTPDLRFRSLWGSRRFEAFRCVSMLSVANKHGRSG